ncbi:tyrosine-type recombinase/integrase [Nocardiopsis sp. NPDC049922]|uniref:tyrosine-type recombinase/integrase n=1 Tax=Nocardiopsis sp. NPDC049922 TaxID=3155157 RepID=UPI003405DCA8
MNLLLSHMDSWALDLQARNRAETTISRYRDTILLFSDWQAEHERRLAASAVRPSHVRDFLRHRQATTSPGTAAIDFRNLRAYFNWLVKEEELDHGENPMIKVGAPKVPEKDIPVLEADDIKALVKATAGRSFENRRDRAIILTLLDNGVRAGGLVGLRYAPHDDEANDVLLDRGQLRVILKGGRQTFIPIGPATAAAIDRYLRERAKHKLSHRKELWLSPKGRLTDSGVRQMLTRRAKAAGIAHVHPHLFRHTAAHLLKEAGLTEEELMAVCGWESAAMAKRYGRSAAAARARAAHRRVSPSDRFA